MKLVHLSDLHLGKRVNEFSMLEDQRYILKQILALIEEERPQAVLIAGDVYDKPVPPAEAVQLFDSFLTDLAALGPSVFVISGNHDSAERIAFGGRLMSSRRVYMAPVYDGHVEPVRLEDEFGDVFVYMLPFIKPAQVRRFWPQEEIADFDAALRVAVGQITGEAFAHGARNVLLAHQLVMGAERCESEELSIGGLDQVGADVFDAFDYVALGHLHGPQRVGRETLRYCGTPLKYSFSEAGQKKSLTVVLLGPKGETEVRTRELRPLHDLREIRGSYEQLASRRTYQGTAVDDYLHITLTDEEDILDALGKLRAIYPNVMKLDYDNCRTRSRQETPRQQSRRRTPPELFEELYQLQNGRPLNERQRELAAQLMREIWEDGE